jgi:hypothetical protein
MIMDLVTKNLMDTFKKEQGFLDDIEESIIFEHFANYCVISKEYTDEFEISDVHVGGGNDLQLDGLAIIVNGVLAETDEAIDDLATTNKYLDCDFIFIQAKTGPSFDGAEISNMFYGIRDLFSETPSLPRNDFLYEKEKLIRHIYTRSALFRRGNPKIKIYYVTTGKWQDDVKLVARIQTEISTLDELNIFQSPIVFEPLDARKVQQYFNRAQNPLSKTITFAQRVTLPTMQGVREAYLGYLPISTTAVRHAN